MDKRYIMPCTYCGTSRIDVPCNSKNGHRWVTTTWRKHFGYK